MSAETFLDGRVTMYPGNCSDVLARLEECSADSCVTDPPYHLTSIVKRFGAANAAPAKSGKTGAFKRASAGFMGKQWDGGDIAFRPELWAEVLRVLKPGAYLVAFGGTRTYHRMASAIEDAGFEIRDQIGWAYGSGFPKSHNQGDGWGTALKPAWEPICLARKPLIGTVAANVLRWGTGALNIGACRVPTNGEQPKGSGKPKQDTAAYGDFAGNGGNETPDEGRWPANVVHDGSDEVVGAFPDAPGQQRSVGPANGSKPSVNVYGDYGPRDQFQPRNDSGSAARFFYTAKADADDRLGSKHPTVKPLDLMQWLVRLVTPPGGTVLDPFAGTGTTGEAAWREGMRAVLIEREAEYQEDIRRRMRLALGGPEERQRESIKARGLTADAGPLFTGAA